RHIVRGRSEEGAVVPPARRVRRRRRRVRRRQRVTSHPLAQSGLVMSAFRPTATVRLEPDTTRGGKRARRLRRKSRGGTMQLQRLVIGTSAAAALGLGLLVAQPAAQARPDNATARCTDGTYSTATARRDACEGHGGVQTWYADEKTKTAAKDAKEDTKDAAKSTKRAAKNAG